MRKKNGFTLVELLAVIVILAIIMIIAIPAVMETTAKAKKQSFFLYAESIQSKAIAKYIADNNEDTDSTDGSTCKVYDIAKLTSEDSVDNTKTGSVSDKNYEGWAKVERVRQPSKTNGIASARIKIDSGAIEYIKYCNTDKGTCTPDKTYGFPEGSKDVTVSQNIKFDDANHQYRMCFNYSYGAENANGTKQLITSDTSCIQANISNGTATINFDESDIASITSAKKCYGNENKQCNASNGEVITVPSSKVYTEDLPVNKTLCVTYDYKDTKGGNKTVTKCSQPKSDACKDDSVKNIYCDFDYITTLTIKTKDYAIENVQFESGMSRETFYDYIDKYKEAHKSGEGYDLSIKSPTCKVGDNEEIKGTTTTHANIVESTTKPTTVPTTVDRNKCPVEAPKVEYKVILEPNGGVVERKEYTYTVGATDKIEKPVRSGYLFKGWFYDKSFSVEMTGDDLSEVKAKPKYIYNDCVESYENVTLYAKWEIDPDSTTVATTKEYTGPTTTEKTTRMYEEIETTTVDTRDNTILLDTLSVAGYNIDFSPIKFYYDLTIPSTESKLGLSYQVHSPDTTDAEVIGNDDLSQGRNLVKVQLRNRETGAQATYTIIVTNLGAVSTRVTQPQTPTQTEWTPESGKPDPTLAESNASLKNLQISGYALGFNPNTYEYVLEVDSSSPLKINATPAEKSAYVNIDGNDKLTDGSVISVYVQSPNGFYNKTYKIEIKYEKEVSNSTKYLRTLVIILGILLIIILIISYLNKKKNFSIIKKTDADKAKEDRIAAENGNPTSAAESTNPAAYIPGMTLPEEEQQQTPQIPGMEQPTDEAPKEETSTEVAPEAVAPTTDNASSENQDLIPGMIAPDDNQN